MFVCFLIFMRMGLRCLQKKSKFNKKYSQIIGFIINFLKFKLQKNVSQELTKIKPPIKLICIFSVKLLMIFQKKFIQIRNKILFFYFFEFYYISNSKMQKIGIYSLIFHILIIIVIIYQHSLHYLPMLIAPLLHILIIKNQSNYNKSLNHTQIQMKDMVIVNEDQRCEICQIDRWVRMRHCYKCQRCIHKYDHHCVLMGICIGEFNHKYYVCFLYSYMLNTLLLVKTLHLYIKQFVTIDQHGIQYLSNYYYFYAICLIALYFNTFLSLFLAYHHTNFMLNNQTTWQMAKRDRIPYLKNISQLIEYPFSQGIINNIKQFFTSNPQQPIKWQIIL